MKNIEYKTFEFKVDGVDEAAGEGRIEGYASTFGNVDLGLDRVVKGAFKKTLQENGGVVPILADHNPYEQLGLNEKAKEDNVGLFVRGSLVLGVQKAKERFLLAKKHQELGKPMGLSIGYATIKADNDFENTRIRNLVELKLYEYSLVTFPMNTQSMLTSAKAFNAIDKVNFLIQHLKSEGISLKDFEQALRKEADIQEYDPMKVSQSLDNLIQKFKN